MRILQEWFPQVVADLHEMGGNSTYYFAPGADPYNPHITAVQEANIEIYGKNNAKWFDRFGFEYFTREVFDEFYPGYGASWPHFHGMIGMTYEQASARGLVYPWPLRMSTMSLPEMKMIGCRSSRISRYAWSFTYEVVTNTPNIRCRIREISRDVSRTPTDLLVA